MKTISLLILVLNTVNFVADSEIEKESIYSIDGKFNYFMIDHLNRLYTVDLNNTITIYNETGNELYSNNFNISGKLSSIDATDPMKIHLFYNEANNVIITDNQLNKIRDINFQNILLHFTTGCRADNGKIILYDSREQKLKAFNNKLQLEFESSSFFTFAKNNVDPVQMQYFNGNIYINDPLNGIFEFDRFGTYLQTFDVKLADNFYILDNKIYFLKNGRLFAYDLKDHQTVSLEINLCQSESKVKQIIIANKRIYCLTENQLVVNPLN